MELSVIPNHGATTEDTTETERINRLAEDTKVGIIYLEMTYS